MDLSILHGSSQSSVQFTHLQMACKTSKSSLRTHMSFFERVAAEIVKSMWQKMVVVNQMLGAYQLAAPGFYAALIHLTAGTSFAFEHCIFLSCYLV